MCNLNFKLPWHGLGSLDNILVLRKSSYCHQFDVSPIIGGPLKKRVHDCERCTDLVLGFISYTLCEVRLLFCSYGGFGPLGLFDLNIFMCFVSCVFCLSLNSLISFGCHLGLLSNSCIYFYQSCSHWKEEATLLRISSLCAT